MFESHLLATLGGYTDNAWVRSHAFTSVVNPANGETLAQIPSQNDQQIGAAIENASRSLQYPMTLQQRSTWLSTIAESLLKEKKELGRIITLEHGKPWGEAIAEVEYAASFFAYYAHKVFQLKPRVLTEHPRNHQWTVQFRPAGVVGLITPWNFPIAMLAKKFSAALAAGCSSVIKPSSKTPLTMIAFFHLLDQIGLPKSRANLVLGSSSKIGELLCSHPKVRLISFTGSTDVGKKLMAQAAPHLKRLALELGGNAPFIVFADADLDQAVDALMNNKFRGGGQTCVCANRVFVQKPVLQSFAEKLVLRVSQMKVADGLLPDTDMGPLIDSKACRKVQTHIEDALQKGAKSEIGHGAERSASVPQIGNFFPPTVLTGVNSQMLCAKEETFGPLVTLIDFENEQEVITMANETEYGLAAYLFTSDSDRAQRVIAELNFGHVGLNSGTGPTAEAPFGGMKQSGFGREGGIEGLHEFIEPQTIPSPL